MIHKVVVELAERELAGGGGWGFQGFLVPTLVIEGVLRVCTKRRIKKNLH
jgi:hypothetical protein